MNSRPQIVILGSGNVATHLAHALSSCADVKQIFSPNLSHAQSLAQSLPDCAAINQLQDIYTAADYYIISVKDDAVKSLSEMLPSVDGIVLHTSGSVPLDAICQTRRGVMYPLQTFSKDVDVNMAEVPIFIEASDSNSLKDIEQLAKSITLAPIVEADSKQRALLHLSAVFACNFTNHLWGAAYNILQNLDCDLQVVKPLILATLSKALVNNPAQVQTGPAARCDLGIIERQAAMLNEHWSQIYRSLSESIMNHTLDQPII